jgi:hypothetical protein
LVQCWATHGWSKEAFLNFSEYATSVVVSWNAISDVFRVSQAVPKSTKNRPHHAPNSNLRVCNIHHRQPGHCEESLSPQSFVQQVKQNAQALKSWSKVYLQNGEYHKLSALDPSVRSIDVVRSESVLRPYIGKLQFSLGMYRGGAFSSEVAAASDSSEFKQENLNPNDCEIDFQPEENAWKMTRVWCRSLAARHGLDLPLDRLVGTPLGDMLHVLESPLNRQKAQPPARRTQM